jgi:hypothetical protein
MEFAGNNSVELEKVLAHYTEMGDKRKLKAAEFLISNMIYEKYSYDGDIVAHYDTILNMYKNLRKDSIFVGDPKGIKNVWDSLQKTHGPIQVSKLQKVHDCQYLKADFLIRNINAAFEAWEHSPYYNPYEFEKFCEYILPYRVGNEKTEDFRNRYYHLYKNIVDTAQSVQNIIVGFNNLLMQQDQYRSSKLLWDYPLDLSITQMKTARRGSCRQLTVFGTQVLRACGLPVAIDRAVWANRSLGHTWNTILLDSGKIFPFDALERRKLEFTYKPSKIFRETFSYKLDKNYKDKINEVPANLLKYNEIDVTNEYVNAYDITIPLYQTNKKYDKNKYAVICVFDNNNWRIVHYGEIKKNVAHFHNMASDVAYIAAYFDNGRIIIASRPFLLRFNGEISYCIAAKTNKETLKLTRKYPRFKKIEQHAVMGLKDAYIEASNFADFSHATKLFSVTKVPYQSADSFIHCTNRFRFVRFYSPISKNANLAEIEFYGKKDHHAMEKKLTGKVIGFPVINEKTEHPYIHAMDGNLETWFDKSRDSNGWVGMDLGVQNMSYLTRVRFCPRSDTNFILTGDKYELYYWDEKWKSGGVITATDSLLNFNNIPSGTIYLLHNHSRGKEERIFTYENGKQVWW